MGHAFDVKPFAEHVPDSGPDSEHLKPETVEQGAGFLDLGFYVDGHRIVIAQLKAGAFTDLFEDGDPTSGKPAASGESSTSSVESDADKARIAELESKIAELEAAGSSSTQGEPPPPAQ